MPTPDLLGSQRWAAAPDLDEPSEAGFDDLVSRAKSYRDTLDPRLLWPGVEPVAIQRAADDIGRAVQSILAGAPATLSTGPHDAEAIGIAGLVTGVGPLLGYWFERGLLEGDAAVTSVLTNHLQHNRRRSSDVASHISALAVALAAQGVTLGVLKGYHTARVYFPEPGTRPFSDVDLVVRPDEVERARSVLRAQGFVEGVGTEDPYKREWHLGDRDGRIRSLHLWHARNPWIIELYGAVVFAHVKGDGARLLASSTFDDVWTTDGVAFRVPRRSSLFAMVAVHASGELYSSRLLRLVELVLMARPDATGRELDWGEVEEFLTSTRTMHFASPALHLVEQLVPGTVDSGLLRRSREGSSPRLRRVMATFTPTSPVLPLMTSIDERLMWTTGRLAVLRRFWLMIAPVADASPSQVLALYRGRLHRFLTGRVRFRMGARDGLGP